MKKPKYELKKGVADEIIHPPDMENARNLSEPASHDSSTEGLDQSDTDESASEGVGDGNIGRVTSPDEDE